MLKIRRSPRAAAFAFLILAAGAGAAVAQDTKTVGPEQLKDFQLPGTRTTPPAQTPPAQTQPQPQPSQTRPSVTPPAAERTPATTPSAERRPEPRPASPAPADSPAATTAAPEPDLLPLPEAGADLSAEGNVATPEAEAPIVLPSAPSNPDLDTLPPPIVADEEPQPSAASWLPWLGVPAFLALLGWAGLTWRRRREEARAEAVRRAAREDLGGALFSGGAAPAAAAIPAPAPVTAEAEPRPWLEVEVKPERAAATPTHALVDYALSIVNSGDAPAGNIRIDARLFNASAEDEVSAFIAGPIHEKSGSPQVVLKPGESLDLTGQAAMPKEAVREVVVEGRRLLIPMIAINVAYDWGEAGAGRTSRSWVVGREPQQPAAKMGAFRLDLGPRIYRSVAGREAKLVKV